MNITLLTLLIIHNLPNDHASKGNTGSLFIHPDPSMRPFGTPNSPSNEPVDPLTHIVAQQAQEILKLETEIEAQKKHLALLQAKIPQLEAKLAAAQNQQEPSIKPMNKTIIYYRPKGSTDSKGWRPVSEFYPLDHDDRYEYARISRSFKIKSFTHNILILKLEKQIMALEKRIRAIELFLYTRFPDTFNDIHRCKINANVPQSVTTHNGYQ